jgi:tRNA(fMet)-specific endonuclease VapC
MLVLDTDLLSLIQRKAGDVYERLNARLELAAAMELICVTIVSFEEQSRGWLAFLARARTIEKQLIGYARLKAHLDDYGRWRVLDFDEQAASIYQRLLSERIRIGIMDLRIAAIALAHHATLLSRNLVDYRKVPQLRVEDWSAP